MYTKQGKKSSVYNLIDNPSVKTGVEIAVSKWTIPQSPSVTAPFTQGGLQGGDRVSGGGIEASLVQREGDRVSGGGIALQQYRYTHMSQKSFCLLHCWEFLKHECRIAPDMRIARHRVLHLLLHNAENRPAQ